VFQGGDRLSLLHIGLVSCVEETYISLERWRYMHAIEEVMSDQLMSDPHSSLDSLPITFAEIRWSR
jgi:hypothetical protein